MTIITCYSYSYSYFYYKYSTHNIHKFYTIRAHRQRGYKQPHSRLLLATQIMGIILEIATMGSIFETVSIHIPPAAVLLQPPRLLRSPLYSSRVRRLARGGTRRGAASRRGACRKGAGVHAQVVEEGDDFGEVALGSQLATRHVRGAVSCQICSLRFASVH